jgi:tartrate/fumarate subfamily iron-sulfur-dependent hydro-lyase beta chain
MASLEYPFLESPVRALSAGELVRLRGPVFTARDRVHRFLHDGGNAPVNLRDGALYHCGPVVIRHDGKWVVRAAGPTTSARNEPYMAGVIRKLGLRLVIGKGGMGEATRKACSEHGCAYLEIVGGAACVVAGAISEVRGVHFLAEFGSAEAMWELVVQDLECVVSIDTHGRSLHDEVLRTSGDKLRSLLLQAQAEA